MRVVYQFGPFQLRPAEYQFLRDGHPIALTHRAFDVLTILVERAGHLIEKQELMSAVWKDCIVEEANLAVTISTLRKVLGDHRTEPKYIETVSRRGYRFMGQVRQFTESVALRQNPDASTSSHAQPTHLEGPQSQNEAVTIRQTLPASRRSWQDLSRLRLGIAAASFIAIAIVGLITSGRSSRAAAPEIRSLAVVPFHDTSADSAYVQASIGITDDLITELGSIGNIAIRPTSSVLKYAGRSIDPRATGHELKVDAVLVGTIAGSGGRMRVAAQLLKTNGSLLWSGTFDKPRDEMFNLEREIGDKVAQTLYPGRAATHATVSQPPDPGAYRMYLEGRYFGNKRSEEGLRKSVEYFQNATIKDPRFALAYAGLADAYTDLAISNLEPAEQAYPNAQAAALRALDIDSTLAEPHAALAKVFLGYTRNWARAGDEFKRAIELNPSFSIGHLRYASYLAASGRFDVALIEALRGQELDPVSLSANSELGRIYYLSRRYDLAVAAFRHTIDLDPNYAGAHLRLGIVYAAQKNYSDAVRELTEAKRLFPHDSEADGLLGYAHALEGNTTASRAILEDLKRRANREYVSKYAISLVYLGLGDREAALDWLAKACGENSPGLTFAGVDPIFDPVRSDSRFLTLMTNLGLPQLQAQNAPTVLNTRTF